MLRVKVTCDPNWEKIGTKLELRSGVLLYFCVTLTCKKMDFKELRGLCEAYTAVYDEDLRDELEEMSDEFAGIENLTDEEIDAIVEETIDEMLDEGYEFDEVEEIFEEVLSEAAKMDRAAARREYMRASEKAAGEARKRGAAVVRKEKRAEKIAKVKGAVKSALGKAKEAAKSGVAKAKEAGKEAKFKAVDKPVAAYATKRKLHPAAGMAARSKDPEKRRGLRAKVAADIKGRIKKKIAQAQVGAYSAARKAGQVASDVAGRAKQSAKNLAAKAGRTASAAASAAKSGAKSAVGKAARKVASGAGRVASRLGEEVDVYDLVLEHLLNEGYADTAESAEAIMVNMSEEWREEILEATLSAKAARAGKDIGKPGKQFEKIAKEAGERYGSKERGEKVAGAVLAKMRAKRG